MNITNDACGGVDSASQAMEYMDNFARIQISTAIGGHIVQIIHKDKLTVHIITADMNFSDKLTEILTNILGDF